MATQDKATADRQVGVKAEVLLDALRSMESDLLDELERVRDQMRQVGAGGAGGAGGAVEDRTGGKVRDDRLRARESQLREARRLARFGTWYWEVATDTVEWTEEVYAIFGLDPSKPPPSFEEHRRIYTPESFALLEQRVKRALETGESYSVELEAVRTDGSLRKMVGSGTVVKDERGRTVALHGFAQDVTEQRALQTERERLAQQRQLALDTAEMGWWHYDPATRVATFDARYCEIHGLATDTWNVEDILKVLHPEDVGRVWATFERALDPAIRESYRAEYRIRRSDGAVRWVESKGIAIFREQADGSFIATSSIGTSQDITERKEAERSLMEAVAQSRLLADLVRYAGQAIAVGYPDGRLGLCNRAFEELTGYTAEELSRISWADHLTPPEWVEPERRVLEHALRTRQPTRYQKQYIRKDGRRIDVEILVHTVFSASGKLEYFYGFITDISERKRAENELKAAKETAEAAVAAKDHFLAVLSHELRTPLTPVLMIAQGLEKDMSLPGEIRQQAHVIRRNIELEARLIDDLLDVSRLTRGKLELNPEATDMHRLIRDTVATCRDGFEQRKQVVELELGATRHVATVDPVRIQQIVWNLLKNANKFTPDGGRVWIRTRNTESGGMEIAVADTGVGISGETLGLLFQPFEQGGREVTRRFGGLGLGLAICHSLATLHQASIKAASEGKDRGAVFTFILPEQRMAEEKTMVQPGSASEPAKPKAGLRILVVEDHPDTARFTSRLLQLRGHQVEVAHTAAEALRCAGAGHFDLVLSDLGLPDATGHELMRQLRPLYPQLKGIAMSGYGTDEDRERSKEAGFSQHLTKPVTLERLLAAIASV